MAPRSTVLVLLGILMLFVSLASAADWPRWRGANADGISTETGINKEWNTTPPPVLWTVQLYAGISYSSPSVVGGKVYILDFKDGKDFLRCFDLQTGKVIWESYSEREEEGCTRSTPTVADGKVYIFSTSGRASCFTADTGTRVWTRQLRDEFNGRKPWFFYNNSPFVDGNKVIYLPAGGADNHVVALNKDTGETIWVGGGSDIGGYATPQVAVLNGVRQYLIFTGGGLEGLEPDTGKVIWHYKWESGHDMHLNPPFVIGDDMIYANSGYDHGGELLKINGDQVTAIWKARSNGGPAWGSKTSPPILYKDCIYQTSENLNLGCLDVKTGKVLWQQGGFGNGGMVMVDGVLIVQRCYENGDLVMVDPVPTGYKELGRIKLLKGFETCPVVADMKLLARDSKTLACFDLNPKTTAKTVITGMPDLVVTDITLTPAAPKAGDKVIFSCTVKNQGTAPTFDGVTIGATFQVEGDTAVSWTDNESHSLANGASVTVTANGGNPASTWVATAGAHKVTAFVDNVNRLVETDENNNKLTVDFVVK